MTQSLVAPVGVGPPRPETGNAQIGLRLRSVADLWRYRDAVRALALLSLRLRYNNSVLGFLWSLGNPLFFMLIFTFVFVVLLPSNIPNYPVFVLAAMMPWNFFQGGMMAAITSITGGRELITKLPFPREILPLSSVLAEFVNFAMALVAILLVLIVIGQGSDLLLLLVTLPPLMTLLVLFTAGMGLLLGRINVRLRDTEEFMKVLTFGWFFVTPIVYSLNSVPADRLFLNVPLRTWIQIINPMSSFVVAFRRVIYEHEWPGTRLLAGLALVSIVVFVVGFVVFRRASAGFAEAI
ncbi:MAG: ABC transporter permease [Aggregatilineales bacterium]